MGGEGLTLLHQPHMLVGHAFSNILACHSNISGLLGQEFMVSELHIMISENSHIDGWLINKREHNVHPSTTLKNLSLWVDTGP